jgi:glycosyltransferase involved in cell wall biosynthesis
MKLYEHHIMKNVDAIVALSPPDYNYVRTHFPEKKVFYIPPEIETEIFNNHGERYDFGMDKYNLLFYGSLDREQNIEGLKYIIETLIPCLKKSGLMSKIRLNIFGSGNPPKDLDLQNNSDVNFLGQVENPGKYIRGADLVIVPIRNSGGMKIRILESLACGKCIIATPEATAGLPDELTKFIPTAKTKEEFVQVIKKFLHGQISQTVDSSNIHNYLNGESFNNVLEYAKTRIAS